MIKYKEKRQHEMCNWRWQVCNSLAILPSVPPGKQSLESVWQVAAIAADAGETYLIVISFWYESELYIGWLAEPYTFWVASQYQIDSSNSTFCLVWKWSYARCPNPSSIWLGGSLLRLNKKYTLTLIKDITYDVALPLDQDHVPAWSVSRPCCSCACAPQRDVGGGRASGEGGGGDVDDGLVVGDSVGPLGQRLSSVRKTPYKWDIFSLDWSLSCDIIIAVLVDKLTRTKVVVVLIVNCLSDSRSNKAVFAPMSRCYCLDGKVCLGQLEVCRLPRRPPVQQQHRPGHGEGNLQPWQRVQGALVLQYGAQWSGHGGKVVDNVGARASSDLPSHNGSLGEHFTYLWTTLQLTNGIPVACHNCCSAIILPPSISWLNIVNIFCQWPSIIIRRANEILRGSVWCPDL